MQRRSAITVRLSAAPVFIDVVRVRVMVKSRVDGVGENIRRLVSVLPSTELSDFDQTFDAYSLTT